MFDLAEVREQLQSMVTALDADMLDPCDAERLVGEFATIEHVAAAGKALAARRVADSGRWRRAGERSEAEWLARATGDSVGAARAALDTAAKVAELPATSSAFRSGGLSGPQASAIASAAHADPASERKLLGMSATAPLTKLRDECDRVRAAATDGEARRQRIHERRYWRKWTDGEGARCGQYRMTPEEAARLEAAAQPFVDAAFRRARDEGRNETSEAYAADGLVDMARAATGSTNDAAPSSSTEMVVVVNLESLLAGDVEPGCETCQIAGVGPVAVSVARDLFGDALLKLVIRDGSDIRTVVHLGRHPTAAQRTAILVRDGGRCVRPTCRRPIAQVDHIAEWSDTLHTTLDELAGLCVHCHRLKTHRGHRYRQGRRGWEWHHPDGTVEYQHPPPDG